MTRELKNPKYKCTLSEFTNAPLNVSLDKSDTSSAPGQAVSFQVRIGSL